MTLRKSFNFEVRSALDQSMELKTKILSESDIQNLPPIVQKYIRTTGFIGKEKVKNFRAEFNGGFRTSSREKFSPLHSVQYNFYHEPLRLFYMVARKMGIPAVALHVYRKQTVSMLIKVLGIFKVTEAKGREMDKGETVTFLNDMCFLAPATLIDKNISWEEIDNTTVEAHFRNGNIDISATLYFKENGELINFVSNDRYETTDGKTFQNYTWLTPVTGYSMKNGHYLPASARIIYKRPDEDFCYGEFNLQKIEYNIKSLN